MKKHLGTFGTILVIVGAVLMALKYFAGMDEIGFWTLALIGPGIILQWIGSRKGQTIG